jgi:RecA/RadA recombinase
MAKSTAKRTDNIKKALLAGDEWEQRFMDRASAVSTGSTLLNLALTGYPDRGLFKGRYYWFVGDSSSGKTFWTLTMLAEASINPNFNDYDLVFDNAEDGALMDVKKFFGPKLAKRLRSPRVATDGTPQNSEDIEDFYFALDERLTAVEQGKAKPFIWVTDSMDALSSKYEKKKFVENRKASRAGKEATGDYGDGKAKINSRWMRSVVSRIGRLGCILVVISQTRDNIKSGPMDFGPEFVVSGGRALKFYACCQIWTSVGREMVKEVNGRKRSVGAVVKAATKKNRLSGKNWSVEVPLYWSHGLDDIGSCVDFLVNEKHWPATEGRINATDFDANISREALIRKIEKEELELDLRSLVADVWKSIEETCTVKRKNRYQE